MTATPRTTRNASSTALEKQPPPILTDEDCLAYAAELEKSFASGDADSGGRLIDIGILMEKSLEGLSSSDKPNEFVEAMRASGATRKAQLLNTIASQLNGGGSFKFIRVRHGPDGNKVLFRLLNDKGGLNYVEFVLAPSKNGATAIDIYMHGSGEYLSQSLRRMTILGASAEDNSLVKRLQGTDSEFSRHSADWTEMWKAYQDHRYPDCQAAYERLSPSLKLEKTFMLFQVLAAHKISEEKYVAAIDAFRAAHPDEVTVHSPTSWAVENWSSRRGLNWRHLGYVVALDFAGATGCLAV